MDFEKLALVCGLAVVMGVMVLGRSSPEAEWRNELQLAKQPSAQHVLLSGWMNMSTATATYIRAVHKKDSEDNSLKSRK